MLLMAESAISRDSDQGPSGGKGTQASQAQASPAQASPTGEPGSENAQVVRTEVVLPVAAAASDNTPTVISKSVPGTNHNIMIADSVSLRGRTLAHFELLEPIGVGGMAAVIRARDKQLDRFVALKILPPEMAVDGENVRRFHQEARAAAKLDHENIARVFFCGEDQNLHFIAFEFVEGENLRTILERHGRVPVPEAVRYTLQIATGLEHAASRGVVHRDIKPSNIIVTPTGRAKLVDMGLARSLEPHGDKALTQSGVTLGTFDYISPEQALEPREADARSDIYSLGCTFYHMVTGQAPVPDGTAAKKLHHHQHIAPLDPRQLNPEIPDEVAAVLSRMMAKDPKDRYQRPVHLIQHLMQVAQRVGAAADVPEGVMFVDAPLPSMQGRRPVLMIALATVFLTGLLFALSLAPSGLGPLGPPPVNPQHPEESPELAKGPKPKRTDPVPSVEGTAYRLPDDIDRLRDVLASGDNAQVTVVVEGVIDLTSAALVFNGKGRRVLNVTGKDTGVILVRHQPEEEDETASLAGILVQGGEANFTNVRFEVEAGSVPKNRVAAVMVQGSGKMSFEKCTFSQKAGNEPLIPLRDRVPLASVAAVQSNPSLTGEKLRVWFKKCYFKTGQDAIAVEGAADIVAEDCGFGPHNALFHLRGKNNKPESKIHLRDCSAFVVNGPAFRLDEQAFCELWLDYSIFSCPESSIFGDEQALILQTDDSVSPHVRYVGKRNCYHKFNLVWGWTSANKDQFHLITKDNFKTEVVKAGGRESALEPSFFLNDRSPWVKETLLKDFKDAHPLLIFQVASDLPELRKDSVTALGIQSCVWGPMSPLAPLKASADPVLARKKNEKVVDPDAQADTPGVYKTLAQAIVNAKSDDIILLKHPKRSRLIEVDPGLNPKVERLTLKPYEGYQPVLTLAETDLEPNAVMFKLNDSELRLESLEILLRATGYRSQAAVALFGDGKCNFAQCLFTIKEARNSRVLVFGDPEQVMKMPSKSGRQMPEAYFKDCFVRGEGDLARFEVSRPGKVDLENSLVALAGSLVTINAAVKEPPMEPAAVVRLRNVSAFLVGALARIKGDEAAKGLVRTTFEAGDCLFASLAGKPLILLDKLNLDENQLNLYVPWTGKKNAYNGFTKMIDQPDSMTFMAPRIADWKDSDARTFNVKFRLPPTSERLLSQAVLDDFLPLRAEMDLLQGYGANLRPSDLPPLTAPAAAETDMP
jgi:hypothetical protein